jgi:hypothetical protein
MYSKKHTFYIIVSQKYHLFSLLLLYRKGSVVFKCRLFKKDLQGIADKLETDVTHLNLSNCQLSKQF